VKPLIVNLATAGATLALLGTLTFPAGRVLTKSLGAKPERARAAVAAAPVEPRRVFGAYVDPWHVPEWAAAVGARPQLIAKFQAFASSRPIGGFLAETERQGIRQVMISWEPWSPVPASLGPAAQREWQFGYSNVDIARGAQDGYVRRFARALAGFRGVVYLRYAHEMNGFWYPWSTGPHAYVLAWRRVVRIFRQEGARNVRFVWSVNPSLYLPRSQWHRHFSRYWPGGSYVDDVGSTLIDFGGTKQYTVKRFHPTLVALRRIYRKPVILTETNTEYRGRVRWLDDLRSMLRRAPWIKAVVWSQLPSRSSVHLGGSIGDLDWDVTKDAPAAGALRRIIEDGYG
jgi:hypothetical protein